MKVEDFRKFSKVFENFRTQRVPTRLPTRAASPLSTLHSQPSTPHSPLSTLHSHLSTLNSPLSTLNSPLSKNPCPRKIAQKRFLQPRMIKSTTHIPNRCKTCLKMQNRGIRHPWFRSGFVVRVILRVISGRLVEGEYSAICFSARKIL